MNYKIFKFFSKLKFSLNENHVYSKNMIRLSIKLSYDHYLFIFIKVQQNNIEHSISTCSIIKHEK